jgi:tetrapyrrole methylase family protein/MazG family protein
MKPIEDLFKIMEALLAPNGCPWDLEQTPQTLAKYAIEEAHELAEALEKNDTSSIKEELGDVLLQVVFHCCLAKNAGQFTFEDVVKTICEKLVRRHPHVFGDTKVSGSEEVLKNWDVIKKAEKGSLKKSDAEFDIPKSLPALQRAQKIGDKTKNLKFDWQNSTEVFSKVKEEFEELQEALNSTHENKIDEISEELGDLFFVLAQLARHLKLDAETVARAANRKFEGRFKKLFELAETKGINYYKLSSNEKELLWREVKLLEKSAVKT